MQFVDIVILWLPSGWSVGVNFNNYLFNLSASLPFMNCSNLD